MRIFVLSTVAVLALAITGASQTASTATKAVKITATAFSPKNVTINTGDAVKWTNRDTKNHQVIANNGAFASGTIGPNKTYSHTFNNAGTFNYHDALHPALTGRIVVKGPAPAVTIGAALPLLTYGQATHISGAVSNKRAGTAVTAKADDSPVTAADLAAHHLILAGLTALDPGIPVLSEEDANIAQSVRAGWQRWWLVDPLDGTKEFISGSEEFTVNIALIENGRVVFGVVSMPTNGRFYVGGAGLGAWRGDKGGTPVAIKVRDALAPGESFTVVASRRHSSPEQERLLAGLSASLGELQLANIGSSLKFCLLAEGAADCYPRLAPTSQWDTAAAQGVLEGAGGEVLELSGEPFSYPARESLLNAFFLALPAKAAWREKLLELARA